MLACPPLCAGTTEAGGGLLDSGLLFQNRKGRFEVFLQFARCVAPKGRGGIISFESLAFSFELDEIPAFAGMAIFNGLEVERVEQ